MPLIDKIIHKILTLGMNKYNCHYHFVSIILTEKKDLKLLLLKELRLHRTWGNFSKVQSQSCYHRWASWQTCKRAGKKPAFEKSTQFNFIAPVFSQKDVHLMFSKIQKLRQKKHNKAFLGIFGSRWRVFF